MLLTLQIFKVLENCMSQDTGLKVNTFDNMIELNLVITRNIACEIFPKGVKITVCFSDKTLDQQVILVNYSYNSTKLVQFEVADITPYLTIGSAIITIKSYGASYTQSIQEITILRSDSDLIIDKIISANYDNKKVTVIIQINELVNYPIKKVTLQFCTNKCSVYENSELKQDKNIWTIIFDAPNQKTPISIFGIQQSDFYLYYGENLESVIKYVDLNIILEYQVQIGELEEVFLYENEIYIYIKSSKEFYEYANNFNTVVLTFDFAICTQQTIIPISTFLSHTDDIELQFIKLQFPDPKLFTNCLLEAFNLHQDLTLGIDLQNSTFNAKYVLTKQVKQSCFTNSSITITNDNIVIYSEILKLCRSMNATYKYQLQAFDNLQSQLLQLSSVIFKGSLNFEMNANFTLILKKNTTLISDINAAYSIYFAVLNKQGGVDNDGQLQIFNLATSDFITFNLFLTAVFVIFGGILGGFQIFFVKKIKKQTKLKNDIVLDDIQ